MSRNSSSVSRLPKCHFALFWLGDSWETLEGIRLPQHLQSSMFSPCFLSDSHLPDGEMKPVL